MADALHQSSASPSAASVAPGRQTRKPFRRWRRAAIGAACLAVIAGVATFIIVPEAWAQWQWRQALHAFNDGDLPRARALLEQCAHVWPESGEAHYLLARTLRRQGDFTAARRHLQAARRHDWAVAALDLEYKLIQAQSGGVRAAEGALHEYVEADHPESPLILEALVQGYLKNNLLNDAYRWCTAWMRARPDQWEPYYWRGLVLERGLRLALAADDYQTACARRPDRPEVRQHLADTLLRTGKYAEAAPHFEAYLRAQPDAPGAVAGYARCLRALARGDEARVVAARHLERSAGAEPRAADALLFVLLGQLEFDAEHYPEALAWLRRAEALTPADRELLQALADVTRRLGQAETSAAYDAKRRQIEADVRRVEDLIKEVVKAEQATPGAPDGGKVTELRYELGVTLLRLGHEAEGTQWLLGALQENPGHAGARKALAALQNRPPAGPSQLR